jgi:chorismate mutase-like protein
MTIKYQEELKHLRQEIDKIDKNIVELIATRLEVVKSVAKIKQELGIPVILPDRINEVLNKNSNLAKQLNSDSDLVRDLFEKIIETAIVSENKIIAKLDKN